MELEIEAYVTNTDLGDLSTAVRVLTTKCAGCHRPVETFCVERCCSDNALLCDSCDSLEHLTHRTNDLKLLFVHQDLLVTREHLLEKLSRVIEVISKLLEQKSELHIELTTMLGDMKEEMQRLKDQPFWWEELYRITEGYINQRLQPL